MQRSMILANFTTPVGTGLSAVELACNPQTMPAGVPDQPAGLPPARTPAYDYDRQPDDDADNEAGQEDHPDGGD